MVHKKRKRGSPGRPYKPKVEGTTILLIVQKPRRQGHSRYQCLRGRKTVGRRRIRSAERTYRGDTGVEKDRTLFHVKES